MLYILDSERNELVLQGTIWNFFKFYIHYQVTIICIFNFNFELQKSNSKILKVNNYYKLINNHYSLNVSRSINVE